MTLTNITPFDEAQLAVDDLFTEAQAWLDGSAIKSQAEAEAVEKLLDLARAAKKTADELRADEKAPHLAAGKAVDARYQPVIKRADQIADACKAVLTPWRAKIEAEKQARAEKARRDAEDERRKADEAIRASAGNIAERARAEEALDMAKDAEGFARREAKRASTGIGLRRSYHPELTDLNAAIRHYWPLRKDEFEALVRRLAAEDVRGGARQIPGFDVLEQKVAV